MIAYYVGWFLLILTLSFPSLGASGADINCDSKTIEQNIQIFWPLTDKVHGIMLIFHGLNQKPSKMDEFSIEFEKKGYLVIRPKFKGHRQVSGEMEKVREGNWEQDAFCFIQYAITKAKEKNLPIYFLGYSMGALYFVNSFSKISQSEKKLFLKAIFVAPALALRFYTELVKLLYPFGDNFVLNSKSPEEYRANSGTSMGGYKSLFLALSQLDVSLKNYQIPTLVFIDSGDELISDSGIEELIKREQIKNWKIIAIDKKGIGPNHLIIDRKSLGELLFSSVLEQIIHFLND